jgi:hypothetical protein
LRWQKLLDENVYMSVPEIAEAERINKSYISRIRRLAPLAPEIVEAILEGGADGALMLERLERALPASWEEQRGRVLSTYKPRSKRRGRSRGALRVSREQCPQA